MTPAMTREQAVEAARALWGPRADSVRLGASYFLGVQKSRLEWDWRAHGSSWSAAVADAQSKEADRRAASAEIKERFARVPVRIDGDVITREWHGKTYAVTRVDGGFEFAGVVHKSLTSIAKSITGATSISGPRFFGLNQKGGDA